jgi:DNA-directed RNA polymerase subunit K
MVEASQFTKYEKARILGARALQIAMNAPLLIKFKPEDLENIKYDALKIAEVEFNSNILPISVKKPFPQKSGGPLKREKERVVSDKDIVESEKEEEAEIATSGEIMEIANPDDENEEKAESSNEGKAEEQ